MLIAIIIFIFGLLIGSFLNVVIYRLPELHTILGTRSHCPKCKTILKWYDLIPFFSFILLKTRCRYCTKPISWQYPLVEVGTGLLFLLLYLKFGFTLYTCYLLLVSCFLIVIFVYDLLHYVIPEEMLWPAIILSLIYLAFNSINQFKLALLGVLIAVAFLGLLYLLGRGKWMGMGDVKLAILLGLLAPFPQVLVVLFVAFVLGSIVGLCLLVLKMKSLKSEIPFGPFLILGLYISIFWGDKILKWYLGII